MTASIRATPADVVRKALATIPRGADGVPLGDPAAWWRESLRLLVLHYGVSYDLRLRAARRFVNSDPPTAAALSLSGLASHPVVAMAIAKAAPP